MVPKSSVEAEYRAMTLTTYEITCLLTLLKDPGLKNMRGAALKSNNQAAPSIPVKPLYHERAKHIEVDCHFIRKRSSNLQGTI